MNARKSFIIVLALSCLLFCSCQQTPKKPQQLPFWVEDSVSQRPADKTAPTPGNKKEEPYTKTYEDAYEEGYEHGYEEMPDLPDNKMSQEQRQAFEDGYEEGLDDSYDGYE